jgi:4-hydroxy-tetrahydrodipicolinate synthase
VPKPDAYKGIIPALQVPFRQDLSIDEADLRQFARRLAAVKGIAALMVNGHTGEVFALTARERTQVARIAADAVEIPVIASVVCEGIADAVEHAAMLRDTRVAAINVMPPHHWLRFGMKPEHVVDYFKAIGDASGLDLTVHVYPSWTRAGYAPELLAELARLPQVKAFKVGTRELNRYARDIAAIREAAPEKAVLTCHDEYLLASMVQGVDGALVGFASLIPELICELWDAVKAGDLERAMAAQARIDPLKDMVYGLGEPSGDAHARMKLAMVMAGLIASPVVRPPIRQPSAAEAAGIRDTLRAAGLLERDAA